MSCSLSVCVCVCVCARLWSSPKTSILGCCTPRDNLCDEDTRVFSDVWVICAPCDTETQTRISLERKNVVSQQQQQEYYI